MKKIQTPVLCFCLCLSMAVCSDGSAKALSTEPASETAAPGTSGTEEDDSKVGIMQDLIEFGLTVNDSYYPIPRALKQYLDDGWSVSAQTPCFLHPMVSGDYYEMRADLSLSEDGKGILRGGSIIRLLEKDGVFLEVTIANREDAEKGEKYRKIEDGVVESITVFYDEAHKSIRLKGMELSGLTPESLQASYPPGDGWTHAPSNYSDYPQFGISIGYSIERNLDNCNRSITVYFNPEYIPFKITVLNETPLECYRKK